jgi:hypothetical protein
MTRWHCKLCMSARCMYLNNLSLCICSWVWKIALWTRALLLPRRSMESPSNFSTFRYRGKGPEPNWNQCDLLLYIIYYWDHLSYIKNIHFVTRSVFQFFPTLSLWDNSCGPFGGGLWPTGWESVLCIVCLAFCTSCLYCCRMKIWMRITKFLWASATVSRVVMFLWEWEWQKFSEDLLFPLPHFTYRFLSYS